MTTIKQLKEYLDALPDETEVEVLVTVDNGYLGFSNHFAPLVIDENTDFVDMTDNPSAKGKVYENNKTLYLGAD